MVPKERAKGAADQYSLDIMRIIREDDTSYGLRPTTLPNNMRIGSDRKEEYSSEVIWALKNSRALLDEKSLFHVLGCKFENLTTQFPR